MDGLNQAVFLEMHWVIKYVLYTRSLELKLEQNNDSDYSRDPVTRKSLSGFMLYVLDASVTWWLKGQKSMTLSSSEAKWVVLSEAVKEIMFVVKLLQSMKISVKIPITVIVENILQYLLWVILLPLVILSMCT